MKEVIDEKQLTRPTRQMMSPAKIIMVIHQKIIAFKIQFFKLREVLINSLS